MSDRIAVAVGLIFKDDTLLVSERKLSADENTVWEFPGGKVEKGETVVEALKRELFEEIGIEVVDQCAWLELEHDYPEKKVHLFVYKILEFKGTPQGLENQALQWVPLTTLPTLPFLEANRSMIDRLLTE